MWGHDLICLIKGSNGFILLLRLDVRGTNVCVCVTEPSTGLSVFSLWRHNESLAYLSQWLHLNGFAPVCFLKCLVNSSLRAKRHSQPSHEHLYGFSPAGRRDRWVKLKVWTHKTKQLMHAVFSAQAMIGWPCPVVIQNEFKSITPEAKAWWQVSREPDSTEPVGSLGLMFLMRPDETCQEC